MRKLLYAGVLAVGLLATGCGGADEKNVTEPIRVGGVNATPTPPVMPGARAMVALAKTKIGKVLVGEAGRTLYLFKKDKKGKSSCSGACTEAWPPYVTEGKPKAGDGVKADLLGITERDGGKTQVTYNGHPLYYFAKDKKAGDITGNDIKNFGTEWYAVTANGTKVKN